MSFVGYTSYFVKKKPQSKKVDSLGKRQFDFNSSTEF